MIVPMEYATIRIMRLISPEADSRYSRSVCASAARFVSRNTPSLNDAKDAGSRSATVALLNALSL